MIDSSDFRVLEAGLKCTQGKSIVNSINLKEGEEYFIKEAVKIRDLGASMIVMAFDEKGQADSIERRIEIVDRAYDILVNRLNISPSDIIFDLNVFPIATGIPAHDNNAVDFIEATRIVKQKYPDVMISGGISNLSFSFRGMGVIRNAIHAVFLYHAINAGLKMGIVNPGMLEIYDNIPEPLKTLVEDVVLNKSSDATQRLLEYAETIKTDKASKEEKTDDWRNDSVEIRLQNALIKGVNKHLEEDIIEALKTYSPIDIIEKVLLEGMNRVGVLFGDGKMFLPQVVKSSRIMKEAVDILQSHFQKSDSGTIGKSNSYMALYPDNSAATRISNVVNTSLPREQNLSANSFNNHLNVSVAYTESDQLFFNNAMGLIKFRTQNANGKNLTRVALRSQGGVLAADNISITMDGNSIASVAATANTHDNIELDALRGEYVSDNTTYYFVVMPGVLNGIELTFSNASGSSSYIKKGESSLTVESGKIADLGTIDINAIESNESGYEISEDGTTYRVSNADGLIAWANAARSNTSLNCVLLDNINMQDAKWTSVGSSENPYNGTFDGGGFTISNFTSDGSFIGWYEGSASNYEIKDLTIENVTVNAQGNTFCIGTFVGVIKGQGGNLTNLKAVNG